MRPPRSCQRKDPSEMTRSELVVAVKRLRKIIDERPVKGISPNIVVAVDRSGKSYTHDELRSVFERVYPESQKALRLMFPTMTAKSIHYRAKRYGVSCGRSGFTNPEDDVIRKRFPDYKRIAEELGRPVASIKKRAAVLGLQLERAGPPWTPEEDALLCQGLPVPGRTPRGMEKRRSRLKINLVYIRAARAMPIDDLRKLIEAHVARNYPEQYRIEAVSDVLEMCLQGRCGIKPDQLAAAGKKAIAAVYKLHPDRGAPVSMDAKLFDDGDATVGDRIASDAFHF